MENIQIHDRSSKFLVALIIIVALLLIVFFISIAMSDSSSPTGLTIDNNQVAQNKDVEQAYLDRGLRTNTAKTSIPLADIVAGGPPKDGIPSIDNPKFASIADTSANVTDETRGIFIEVNGEKRFYPYNILVFHEIVNDVVNGKNLVITFCPLCGTGIVFVPDIGGESIDFGVSGLLHESNLLMYDRKTESLWSQVLGQAVVGELLGTKLELYPSQLLTFAEVKANHPTVQVLTEETGASRNYNFNPYGNYDEDDDRFLFETPFKDTRLPAKQIMYAVNFEDKSIAFVLADLRKAGKATLEVNGTNINVKVNNGEISVIPEGSTESLPGFFSMWFSWILNYSERGIVWANGALL